MRVFNPMGSTLCQKSDRMPHYCRRRDSVNRYAIHNLGRSLVLQYKKYATHGVRQGGKIAMTD